jgi:hypothetical protein
MTDSPDKVVTRAWSELTSLSLDASAGAIAARTGLAVFDVATRLARLRAIGALPAVAS